GPEARDTECLHHGVRPVVTDAAGGELVAVTDQIVLVSLDLELILDGRSRVERCAAALGHRERVVRELDPLVVLVPLVEWEIDDPGELEPVLVNELQVLADLVAGQACKPLEAGRVASDEEAGIAFLEAKLLANAA